MNIRKAEATDVAAISKLVSRLTRETIAHDFTPEARTLLLVSMNEEAVGGYLNEGYDYLVAEESGRLVGVVATRDDTHLFHLFVAESHQGQGLSRKLWEQALERCRQRSGGERFTVNSSLNAVGVYRRFGFVADSAAISKKGVVVVPMTLTLPPRQRPDT